MSPLRLLNRRDSYQKERQICGQPSRAQNCGGQSRRAEEAAAREREKRRQQAVLAIKKKYGKNAILKGMDLEEGATARDRNGQIGGHKA